MCGMKVGKREEDQTQQRMPMLCPVPRNGGAHTLQFQQAVNRACYFIMLRFDDMGVLNSTSMEVTQN